MITKTIVLERKQQSWSEDSSTMDARLIKGFIESHPDSKIITAFHSGVKHLLIIYEE